jgi:hypothetical protein
MSSEHTPTPWTLYSEEIDREGAKTELAYQVDHTDPFIGRIYLLNARGKCPATTGCGPTSEANAEFIVRAVNAHDELVAALKWFAAPENWREEQLSDGPYLSAEWKLGFDPREIAKRAIAKAEA